MDGKEAPIRTPSEVGSGLGGTSAAGGTFGLCGIDAPTGHRLQLLRTGRADRHVRTRPAWVPRGPFQDDDDLLARKKAGAATEDDTAVSNDVAIGVPLGEIEPHVFACPDCGRPCPTEPRGVRDAASG